MKNRFARFFLATGLSTLLLCLSTESSSAWHKTAPPTGYGLFGSAKGPQAQPFPPETFHNSSRRCEGG